MSAGGAFGGARGYQPKPPDKGVFPLDHFGECKAVRTLLCSGLGRVLVSHQHPRLFVELSDVSVVFP